MEENGAIHLSGNIIIAFIVSAIMFTVLAYVFAQTWTFLLSIIIGYIISDVILSFVFITGGEGLVRVTVLGKIIKKKGHNFLAYTIGIILASIISAWVSQGLVSLVTSSNFLTVFIINMAVLGILSVDFHYRFYENTKNDHAMLKTFKARDV